MSSRPHGVIVDGYSSGSELARAFDAIGIPTVHVQSAPVVPDVYRHTFRPDDYVANLSSCGDIHELAGRLAAYDPCFVVPGAEPGVELAEALAVRLELPRNDDRRRGARRNKHLMARALEASGVECIPHVASAELGDLLAWARRGGVFPLVAKPLESGGGDGVTICQSLADVEAAYGRIMSGGPNVFGLRNEGVLLQRYVDGREYVVNTVSHDGRHHLCELWSYARFQRGGCKIYDTASLVAFDEREHGAIVDYAMRVADGLGIRQGPMHAEVMVHEGVPVLIEAAARVMGGNLPMELMSACLAGRNQSRMTALAYGAPETFRALAERRYELSKRMVALFLVSDQSGRLRRVNHLEEIAALPSVAQVKLRIRPGDALRSTVDYATSPGMIYLAHEDPDVVVRDCMTIRSFERGDMYEIEQDTGA
jgi:biotin carboxylase